MHCSHQAHSMLQLLETVPRVCSSALEEMSVHIRFSHLGIIGQYEITFATVSQPQYLFNHLTEWHNRSTSTTRGLFYQSDGNSS